MDIGKHFALQTAGKPWQIAIRLLGTYQRPIQRYHRRPTTMYRLATIHNITDRQFPASLGM